MLLSIELVQPGQLAKASQAYTFGGLTLTAMLS